MKSGIGSSTVWLDGSLAGVRVAALAAVNAVGDVYDDAGRIVAGTRETADSMNFADSARMMKRGERGGFDPGRNTTLVVVATNAKLTKVGANKLAQLGSLGVARAIRPVWTMSDGDTVFAMSHGEAQAPIDALGVAAAEAVAEAIVRAVRMAESAGGVPSIQAESRR
jgi:L-aminopeptidase/D-esterase-like protein